MVIRELLVAFGVITDDDAVDRFDAAVERARSSMERAADAASSARDRIAALVGQFAAVALAAGTAGAALAVNSADVAASALAAERQAAAFGLSVDAYQELRAVFEDYGVDQRDLADLLAQITQQAAAASGGATTIAAAFAALGVSVDDVKGADPVDVLYSIAEGMKGAENAAARVASASTLLGEDLTKKVVPLLQSGAAGMDRARKAARDLGLVLDATQIAAGKRLTGALTTLRKGAEGVRRELGAALAPALADVVESANAWLKTNRAIVSAGIAEVVDAVGGAFLRVRDAALRADRYVRVNLEGWRNALTGAAVAAGTLFAALAAFRAGGAAYYAMYALYAVVAALAAALGVGLGSAALVLAGVLSYLATVVAPIVLLWTALALAVEDFVTFAQGGRSILGDLADGLRGTAGAGGALAEALDQSARLARALYDVAAALTPVLVGLADRGLGYAWEWVVALGGALWTLSAPLRWLADWLAATAIGDFARSLSVAANAAERIAAVMNGGSTFADAFPMAAATGKGIGEGFAGALGSLPSARVGTDLRGAVTGPGGAVTAGGPVTVVVNGAGDPSAVAAELVRRSQAAAHRAALAAYSGGER